MKPKRPALLLLLPALLLLAPACNSTRRTASLGGVLVSGEIAEPVRAAQEFLTGHPDLEAALGAPVRFGGLGADIRPGLGTAVVSTKASGPGGTGPVDVNLVQERGRWKATSGELKAGEQVVALRPR